MRHDRPIYLDHHATTPTDPRVVEAMLPFWTERFGNAATREHPYGWEAAQAVEAARAQVAGLVGGAPEEIVWTSGATEANNLAIKGALWARGRGHLVTSAAEHASVRNTAAWLADQGWEVTVVPVDGRGRVDPAGVRSALRPETVLVSVIHGNNEVGTVNDAAAIGALCREAGVLFHLDAVQTAGLLPLDPEALGADLMSLSAHKLHGPKGVGALWVRRRRPPVRLVPLLHGGAQEGGLRAGTLPVPLVVGFGEAARLAHALLPEAPARIARLRDRLEAGLREAIPTLRVHGDPAHRLPGNLHCAVPGVPADRLLAQVRAAVALSAGSACASGTASPSPVLEAMGLPPEEARASLRFGVGRGNDEVEIDEAVAILAAAVDRLQR